MVTKVEQIPPARRGVAETSFRPQDRQPPTNRAIPRSVSMFVLLVLSLLWGVVNAGIDQFSALAGKKLWQDLVTNQGLATGASFNYDLECTATDWLVIEAELTGAANGDLAITVTPYEADGITLQTNTPLPPVAASTVGPTFGGGVVQYIGKYDVLGIRRVRITAKNNNAGAQTLNRLSWRTQGY